MKNCVVTMSYACPPAKVWLYISNPALNHWRKDVSACEISSDGMEMTLQHTDGAVSKVTYSRKEKPRRMDCTFIRGKIRGNYTVLLLGGGDSTSVECTLDVEGLGLFAKPQKLMNAYFEELRVALGE